MIGSLRPSFDALIVINQVSLTFILINEVCVHVRHIMAPAIVQSLSRRGVEMCQPSAVLCMLPA